MREDFAGIEKNVVYTFTLPDDSSPQIRICSLAIKEKSTKIS